MGKLNDITGRKFGRITVLSLSHINKNHKSVWNCVCECGTEIEILGNSLLTGRTTSCGCYNSENCIKVHTTHGMSKSRFYYIYHGMLERCYNTENTSYEKYGAKGVEVCDRWRNNDTGFSNFTIDMFSSYDDNLTIDRINPSGNYEPDNCRWIPAEEQARNRTKRSDNTSGTTGLILYRGFWYARWVDLNGVLKSKAFSVKRHGKEAEKMALAYRNKMIEDLNNNGANYNTEYHGKDRECK